MTAETILRDSAAAGVTLSLSAAGTIKATGEKAAVASWLATITANRAAIITMLAEAANDPLRAGRWLIHFADRNPLPAAFLPAATHAEVLDTYPNALAAEPIEPGRRQPDTLLAGDQEAAVLAWLAQIGETDQAIVAEVLTACRYDCDARAYYLGRAGADPQIGDDRRRCTGCGNLQAGVCTVARPGGRVSALVGYRPASLGVLQRCAGYSPNASDTDHRPGRERWPGLIQKGGE